MPPLPPAEPIVSPSGEGLGEALWQALSPERWPLDPALLPPGTALVGGAVRDALLGRLSERPDLDLVVCTDALQLARDLASRCGGSVVVLDRERSIARLVLRGWNLDLARRMGPDLKADLLRRDYTVNAIALPIGGRLDPIDPSGGLHDLHQRRLQAVSEANLLEDPLRLLRGPRLACELDFTLEDRTRGWIHSGRERLTTVAGERVLAELERLAQARLGSEGLIQTLNLGLLEPWQEDGNAACRALESLSQQAIDRCGLLPQEQAWALPLARLAATLPAAALERLRSSRRLQQRCGRLQRWQQRLQGEVRDGIAAGALEQLAERERLELQLDLEQDWPALALQLHPEDGQRTLMRWRDPDDPLFHPRPPLDGLTLQRELGLPPGRSLGRLLAHLMQERAFCRLAAAGDHAAVLAQARHWQTIHNGSASPSPPAGPVA